MTIIGFDADDTLWVNETYFREAESRFYDLMAGYGTQKQLADDLHKVIMQNLSLYGYGIKSLMLSMTETALGFMKDRPSARIMEAILSIGKEMLNKPVILLDGIQDALAGLRDKGYTMILATKGDLLDQERKLRKSGMEDFFHHIEIMSEKNEDSYLKLLSRLHIRADEFVMVGNSLRSDILPVVNIGGFAIHIPSQSTWVHEMIDPKLINGSYRTIRHAAEIPAVLEAHHHPKNHV